MSKGFGSGSCKRKNIKQENLSSQINKNGIHMRTFKYKI